MIWGSVIRVVISLSELIFYIVMYRISSVG